ncbi:hypothetical protein PISL3812_08112 [Talaromyces islandicus]|uniref:Uncharacterized protein n=1 Tax=Talaromyces islandicus TaxID=28573 RepID=A0A0U1M665_TALIS|nr:hypothetical protein PISL3812_08112 [Talaromyces islandicus]
MPNRPVVHDDNAPSRPAPRRPAFSLNTPVRSANEANRQPSRQFASAPRFLLPQDDRASRDGVDRFRQRAVSSPFGQTPASRAFSPRRPVATPTPRRNNNPDIAGDEIEEEDEQERDREPGADIIERRRDDTSPFEDLFAPPDPNKKRRISHILADDLSPAPSQSQSQSQDTISSFEARSPPSPEQERVRYTLASPFPHPVPPNRRPLTETPAPSRRKFILEPKTPKFEEARDHHSTSTNTQTPAFRSPPRYLVSGNYTPSAPDEPPTPQAGGSSSDKRVVAKRPAFVLPRSPSPPDPDSNANSGSPPPAPSSPTSTHSLGRRGRPKSTTSGYVPGGMAEQVRNWILEMGMKREQQTHNTRPHSFADPGRYSFTARIESCRNGYLASSGPVIIVYATPVPTETNQQDLISQPNLQRNILLLGQPKLYPRSNMQGDSSTPGLSLKTGDVIGIPHSGLTWEIELDDDKASVEGERKVVASSQSSSSEDDDEMMDANGSVRRLTKWQVAAEWDLLTQSLI